MIPHEAIFREEAESDTDARENPFLGGPQLKLIVSRVAFAASLFDDDGIEVRFMNSRVEGNGLRTEHEANQLVSQVRFSGLTPLGTNLNNKVLEPLVLNKARARQLQKPVLIIASELLLAIDLCFGRTTDSSVLFSCSGIQSRTVSP